MKNIAALSLLIITAAMSLLLPTWAAPVSVSTSQWAPYIHAENKPLGTAADILRQVLSQDKEIINWRYQNYDLAFELVANNKQEAAFPYFKTKEREQRVLYSQPVLSVTSGIYYNRQREDYLNFSTLNGHKFGRVSGYSYGQVIDAYLTDAIVFPSESDALESLFKNEIDFLPMTESVMNTMLNSSYSDQALLIKKIDKVEGHDTLHLIAPNTAEGKKLINKVNRLLAQVSAITSLKPKPVLRFKPKDIARLITAEGYPAIVGQTSLDSSTDYYTLPQGTKVLILNWSDKIVRPSTTDRIYKSMIDLSKVVVLNGPHVGKELYIKNMHLEIQ
ncbi:substrate-binding periplasmic protein [Thalassotalea piscium]|uniref:Polar amino acid transport system substrate-binding protein n=1 Tax=Thalassotalea piscium TaxID=1230533 RepID=A0A7X0TTS9_9GAMM|nr:transporter substrate-binding domain-containing protein [Thalassotalea piscium]MBB6543587.1 polar amino acid transport system substrate-binding protein [Thalassotalea piscium]